MTLDDYTRSHGRPLSNILATDESADKIGDPDGLLRLSGLLDMSKLSGCKERCQKADRGICLANFPCHTYLRKKSCDMSTLWKAIVLALSL